MEKRFWIIFVIVLIVGLAVFLFLTWQNKTEDKRAPIEGLATGIETQKSGESVGNKPVKEPELALKGVNLITEESKGLEFKPFFEDAGEKIEEAFLERFYDLANPPISIPQTAPQITASVPMATSTGIILSLTDEEFHFLYPPVFISSLISAQSLFISEYDPSYVPLSKIENDSQVRSVEEKIVSALLALEMITKEQADIYIKTIRFTLPELQITELKNRKVLILNKFVPTIEGLYTLLNKKNPAQIPKKGLFFSGLLDKLHNLLINKALAACGHCYSLPECFQVGLPTPYVGFNIFKYFCRCTGCYYGQGCLDFCEGWSAIWDPTTGICGCDKPTIVD